MSERLFAAALKHYSAALVLDSAAAMIYNKRAAAYSAQGNNPKALQDYDHAVSLDPAAPGARIKRAKLRRECCELGRASEDLEAVLLERPTHKGAKAERDKVTIARMLLADAEAEKRGDMRRQSLVELFKVSPHCSPARLMEAELLLAQKDYGGVILTAGQVLKAEPSNIVAYLLRGKAYDQVGDLKSALAHFSQALRSDPDHPEAKTLFKDLKKLQKHIKQAEEAAKAGDHRVADIEYLWAIDMCKTRHQLMPGLLLDLCKLRLKAEQGGPAVEACGRALEWDPGSEDVLVHKVRALILNKEFDVAHREASNARQKFGNSQQIYQVFREAEQAQKMAERKQYYDILGLAKGVSEVEIKRAYRELARKFHPDKASLEGISQEAAQEKFTEISEAYEVLSDPERRSAYDDGRDLQMGAGQAGGHHSQGFPAGFQHGGQQFHFQWG